MKPQLATWIVALLLSCSALFGQQAPTTSNLTVPRLVNFSGRAVDPQGKVIYGIAGATFAIYKDQYGGSPLWIETQNVQADAKGNYVVQLGATKPEGLPLDLFTSGEGRWLGVAVNGGQEQPRVLLLSVPYALKAADAETIGGLPPSAFVLAAPIAGATAANSAVTNSPSSSTVPPPASGVTTNGGTVSTLPLWSTATDIETSAVAQTGSGTTAKIGINTTKPATTLDVNGAATIRGNLSLPSTGTATATTGKNSQPATLTASAFNSTTGTAVAQNFRWQAEPVSNNTANASGSLNLLSSTGSNALTETGLKIARSGQITFASGQTFPGTGSGTVTSVGLSAPSTDFVVSGSPVTAAGTLALNWTVAPTSANTANAIVKRDSSGNIVAGIISAASLNATNSTLNGTLTVGTGATITNAAGPAVVASTSGSFAAVKGTSTGTNAVSDGVDGIASSGSASGVAGINNGGGVGVYGIGAPAVYGGSSGAAPNAFGVWGQIPSSAVGLAAVYGEEGLASAFGLGSLPAGVWGDTNVANGTAVFGSADGGWAGWFENNSGNNTSLTAINAGGANVFDASGTTGSCHINSAGHLTCTGGIGSVVTLGASQRKVALAAIASPENWFEDFGSGQLHNGVAVVELDPDFVETVNAEKGYKVFPVPNGDCKGLYVTQKGPNSFEVRELGGGRSNISFDYRITAIRRNYESVRFADHSNDPDPKKILEKLRKAKNAPTSAPVAPKRDLLRASTVPVNESAK